MGTLHPGKVGSAAAPESEDLGFRAQKTVPRNSSSDLDGRLSATSFFLLLPAQPKRPEKTSQGKTFIGLIPADPSSESNILLSKGRLHQPQQTHADEGLGLHPHNIVPLAPVITHTHILCSRTMGGRGMRRGHRD